MASAKTTQVGRLPGSVNAKPGKGNQVLLLHSFLQDMDEEAYMRLMPEAGLSFHGLAPQVSMPPPRLPKPGQDRSMTGPWPVPSFSAASRCESRPLRRQEKLVWKTRQPGPLGSLLKVLRHASLAWTLRIDPTFVHTHPSNRDRQGVSSSEVHSLCSDSWLGNVFWYVIVYFPPQVFNWQYNLIKKSMQNSGTTDYLANSLVIPYTLDPFKLCEF